MVGKERSVDKTVVSSWQDTVLVDILRCYLPEDILNADGTALFYRMLPSKSLVEKGESCRGSRQSNDRVTVLVCARMAGEQAPLLVLRKSKNPRCFHGVWNLPVEYNAYKNDWMTSSLFKDWVRKLDRQMANKKRKICLIVDNCLAHPNLDNLTNTELVFLPLNCHDAALSSRHHSVPEGAVQKDGDAQSDP